MPKRKFTFNAEDYAWVEVDVDGEIYRCLWAMKHYYRATNPVYVGDLVQISQNGAVIAKGTVVSIFATTGQFEMNKVYCAQRIPIMLNGDDYIWVRVQPDDFYEDGHDAIWQRIDDNTEKPVKLGDKVYYYRKHMTGRLVGKVVAIGPAAYHFETDERYTYFADPITTDDKPPIAAWTPVDI